MEDIAETSCLAIVVRALIVFAIIFLVVYLYTGF